MKFRHKCKQESGKPLTAFEKFKLTPKYKELQEKLKDSNNQEAHELDQIVEKQDSQESSIGVKRQNKR